jgi:hypothetical protein
MTCVFPSEVLRAQQQVDDRRGHAALEQHRLAEPADGPEQRVVLHVARAHLNKVRDLGHAMRALLVERLGDDRQPGLASREGEQLEPLHAEPLERVG